MESVRPASPGALRWGVTFLGSAGAALATSFVAAFLIFLVIALVQGFNAGVLAGLPDAAQGGLLIASIVLLTFAFPIVSAMTGLMLILWKTTPASRRLRVWGCAGLVAAVPLAVFAATLADRFSMSLLILLTGIAAAGVVCAVSAYSVASSMLR